MIFALCYEVYILWGLLTDASRGCTANTGSKVL